MRYFVYNHHDFWKWEDSNSELMDSNIVFIWSDWPFGNATKMLKGLGKKVIVYEHGFGSMFDYELNDREPIADGYLVLGQESKGSLIRVGVDPSKILITGNPVYDDIKKTKHTGKEALFVALHWVKDVSYYNQTVFEQLKTAYPQFNWTVKLMEKTGSMVANKKWISNSDGNILDEIKERLPEFDKVFTPRPSTFESMARLMGIPVYVVDKEESYKNDGDPERVPMNNTYIKIGQELPEQKPVDMGRYIKRPSLSLDLILEWAKTL
jgi:hypothetical protein